MDGVRVADRAGSDLARPRVPDQDARRRAARLRARRRLAADAVRGLHARTPRPGRARPGDRSPAPIPTAPCRVHRRPPPHHRQPARRRPRDPWRAVRPLRDHRGTRPRRGRSRRRRQPRRDRQPAARRDPVRHPRHPWLAELRRLAGQRHQHPSADLLRLVAARLDVGPAPGRRPGGRGRADLPDRAGALAFLQRDQDDPPRDRPAARRSRTTSTRRRAAAVAAGCGSSRARARRAG